MTSCTPPFKPPREPLPLPVVGSGPRAPAVMRYARQVYGNALLQHSRSLKDNAGPTPSAAAICTCMMLSYFETIYSANYEAYGTHLRATRRMMAMAEAADPYQYLFRQLENHVHCQTVSHLECLLRPNMITNTFLFSCLSWSLRLKDT